MPRGIASSPHPIHPHHCHRVTIRAAQPSTEMRASVGMHEGRGQRNQMQSGGDRRARQLASCCWGFSNHRGPWPTTALVSANLRPPDTSLEYSGQHIHGCHNLVSVYRQICAAAVTRPQCVAHIWTSSCVSRMGACNWRKGHYCYYPRRGLHGQRPAAQDRFGPEARRPARK